MQQILVLSFLDSDVALYPAQDSPADRAAVSGSVPDHEHRLPQEIGRDILQIDEREVRFCVDLDKGEILLWVARDVVGVVDLSVVHRHLYLQIGGALHDVLVRHDVACRVDDESRAEALKRLPDFAGTALIIAEELCGEIFKGIVDPAPHDPLRINIDDCGQHLGYRLHRRLRSGIGLGEKRRCAEEEDHGEHTGQTRDASERRFCRSICFQWASPSSCTVISRGMSC